MKRKIRIAMFGTVFFSALLTIGIINFDWWIVILSAVYGIGLFMSINILITHKRVK